MVVVFVCGQSCCGKSNLCLHLYSYQSYANMPAEKNLRGVLRSQVDWSVSRYSVIIVDSLNNIKGYRYELWCLAHATGIRYCVLFCDVEEMHCRKWNQERVEKGDGVYDDDIFDDLVSRFERPDRRNWWDSPLFELWQCRDGIQRSSPCVCFLFDKEGRL